MDLHLDDRQPDRVRVTVRLEPDDAGHPVDGVALQLCSEGGECLGPRLLLPIQGRLAGPLVTRVELRSLSPIPENGRVVAVAWWGCEQVEVTCPSDRHTTLRDHVRGAHRAPLAGRVGLERLDDDERAAFYRLAPWAAEPRVPRSPRLEPVDPEPSAEEICEELGLEGEDAEWLKDLLEEDDDLI